LLLLYTFLSLQRKVWRVQGEHPLYKLSFFKLIYQITANIKLDSMPDLLKNKRMKNIELLAPAKNKEAAIIAIKCGADAVYIGATSFGARASAGNSVQDIAKIANFAHKFGAKVYVTVNTILNNNEIAEAQKLMTSLWNEGIDAVIIQDMGLLELDLPPVPLFASTQTHNNSPEKVFFLEKVGFQRVILSRELALDEIKKIKSATNIELESFIHGALCVCYSGQCYMSYAIGGRSGNRGECAQPCRKKYSLLDEKGNILSKSKHLLSLKDLNLSNKLQNLLDAGITSFKIEGRLKDENYVKNIVSYYRQELDKILEDSQYNRSSSGKSFISFTTNPYKTFNRGYSEYFVSGTPRNIASIDTPKSTGEVIGDVMKVTKHSFEIDSKTQLNNADGLCFFDETGELCGTTVNTAEGSLVFPQSTKGISVGTKIFRNLDFEFLKSLKNAKIERKIKLDLFLTENNGEIKITTLDEDGITSEISIPNSFEPANNKEKAIETIEKQLLKLGDSDYYSDFAEINLQNPPFIPVNEINKLRRELISLHDKNRLDSYTRNTFEIKKNDFPYPENTLDYRGNILNTYAENFYRRHGVVSTSPAAESGIDLRGKQVMTTKYCIKKQLGLCAKEVKKSPDTLYLQDEMGHKYTLKFNCKKCEMEVYF